MTKADAFPPGARRFGSHDTHESPTRNEHRTCTGPGFPLPTEKLRSVRCSQSGYRPSRAEIPCGVLNVCELLGRRRRSGPVHPGGGRGLPSLQMACASCGYYIAKLGNRFHFQNFAREIFDSTAVVQKSAFAFLGLIQTGHSHRVHEKHGHFLVHKNRTLDRAQCYVTSCETKLIRFQNFCWK